ncbi:MAG TPA: type II methionyl aminopeptidase [Candidatus Thermoplasmatota archaeon]|nr:type II methionyl aminopeptidase [Candidatus Thermoplasmatota archaeon]
MPAFDAKARESYLRAGELAGKARALGATLVKAGARHADVADAVEAFIRDQGAAPAFPCCISVDSDAAHNTPGAGDPAVFAEGQVVKLDCGVHVDGYIGDTAITVEVGTNKYAKLKEAAGAALRAALDVAKPNVEVATISGAIETTIRGFGYQPIVNLTGHSVDHYVQHAGVSIPSIAATARGRLAPGMAVAIEPFVTDGKGKIKDSVGGHIYHYMAPKPQRDPHARAALDHIQKNFDKLPFAERWLVGAVPPERITYALRLLERTGAVKQYPILREIGAGQVAQFEHTILVEDDGIVVTTQ